ncbi:hypothetical protein SOVF_038510 [Spinacia oleracea]|nr:hypothetical protein SOVF_038510 [Spinacia oleracea]
MAPAFSSSSTMASEKTHQPRKTHHSPLSSFLLLLSLINHGIRIQSKNKGKQHFDGGGR